MTLLVVAALLWLGLHAGVSGTPLRGALVGLLGERPFRGVFSVLSVAFLVLLIVAFGRAQTTPIWFAPPALVAVVDAAMLVALIFFAGAFLPARGAGEGPRGIRRITRHPLMAAIGLWAAAHLVANGDTAALVFFGALLLTVLLGVPASDRKSARRDPAAAAALFAQTSRLPFAAILAGRNRLSLAEIGWLVPLAGLVAWGLIAYLLHPWLIGVPAIPVW